MNHLMKQMERNESLYYDDLRRRKSLISRVSELCSKWTDLPVELWPEIEINWDVKLESQYYCLDRYSPIQFHEDYPKGFAIGYVNLQEFDEILNHFSRRDDGELWELGFKDKLSFLIQYTSENNPLSPPLVKPCIESREVILSGGNHRYALAKAINCTVIPICTEWKYINTINGLVDVKWESA